MIKYELTIILVLCCICALQMFVYIPFLRNNINSQETKRKIDLSLISFNAMVIVWVIIRMGFEVWLRFFAN